MGSKRSCSWHTSPRLQSNTKGRTRLGSNSEAFTSVGEAAAYVCGAARSLAAGGG